MTQRLQEEEWTRGKVMSSEWGTSSWGHWWAIQKEWPPLCAWAPTTQVSSLPSRALTLQARGLCAVCSFVSPALPPQQISASGSFHRVASSTRPCFLAVFLHVMDHSVLQIVSVGDDLVHARASSPACELPQDRDHVFLVLMSTEPRTF